MGKFLEQLIPLVVNNILIPLILTIVPILLIKFQDYIKALIVSMTEKNQNDSISALNEIVLQALAQLETIVKTAVSANMVFAERYKAAANDGKLTEDEIIELNELAKQLIYDTLPIGFQQGNLLEILGGQIALDKLISSMIEKVLLDMKKSSPN
jgi:hypothetical protein